MNKKVLAIVMIFVFMMCLIGCSGSVGETEFPTGFTRVSDGVQIELGMSQIEIEQKLKVGEHDFGNSYEYDEIGISFINETASSLITFYPSWHIQGISVGDSMQEVLDNFEHILLLDDFANPITTDSDSEVVSILVLNNKENPNVSIHFRIDEHREIYSIVLLAVERAVP